MVPRNQPGRRGATRHLATIGIAFVLVVIGCGDTADTTEGTPPPTEAPRESDATTTTSPPEVEETTTTSQVIAPTTTTQDAQCVSDAASASGEIDFLDRVNDVSFTDRFSLEPIPPGSDEIPESFEEDSRAITGLAWLDADDPALFDNPIVLRQQRPGFEDQNTYGLLSACQFGSQRGITIGRAPTHTEIYLFRADCLDLLCTEADVEGFSMGFAPGTEIDGPFIDEVDIAVESGKPPPGSVWFFGAAGQLDLAGLP